MVDEGLCVYWDKNIVFNCGFTFGDESEDFTGIVVAVFKFHKGIYGGF